LHPTRRRFTIRQKFFRRQITPAGRGLGPVPRELRTYSQLSRTARNAPAIMSGPNGICCFLVARPDIRSAVP